MPGVAFPGAGAGGNFLEQILGDLLQLMGGSSPGGARIDLARTLAQGVASGGEPEGNVDPADRMRFEELAHVAELHVAELTGLPITPTGAAIEISAVAPGAWAWETVEEWRFLLEAMAEPPPPPDANDSAKDIPRPKGTLGYVDTSGDLDASLDFDPDIVPGSDQGPADLLARLDGDHGADVGGHAVGLGGGPPVAYHHGPLRTPHPPHRTAPARGARQRHPVRPGLEPRP